MELKQLDRELDEIEKAISQLKREFETYFAGVSKQPPLDSRTKLEKTIRKYGQHSGFTYAQRFRFGTLAARFNTYQDLWEKQLRLKEEGKLMAGGALPPPATLLKEHAHDRKKSGVDRNVEKIFSQYVSAKQENGEKRPTVNLDKFKQLLASQKDTLMKKYHCKDVEFYVAVEDGRTKLKARPVK